MKILARTRRSLGPGESTYREMSWRELAELHVDREILDVGGVSEQARAGVDAGSKLVGALLELLIDNSVLTELQAFELLQSNHYDLSDEPEFKLIHDGGRVP